MQDEIALPTFTRFISDIASGINRLFSDKRLVIGIILLAAIAIHFWAGSRVPALNEKALMGGDTQLAALGFETVFAVSEDDPLVLQVAFETINWLKTNQRGMTFGVLFASTLMLILTLFKKRSFRNPFANSLLGMVIGAPLGVCVNCAAPIAKGLYAAGARVETTLAAMISSPTLNVIVLTMSLSLFPFYLVVIKLGFTIGFIVLFIPLLTRLLARDLELNPADAASCPIDFNAHEQDEGKESWSAALAWVAQNWLRSFWNVVKTTVPLMFLAGALGSLLVTVLPWESLSDLIPADSRWMILANMAVLAVVGIFLPVPIAFDIIIVAILLATGMPVYYAMVLLFTLGIYSCYSFFIIWREISRPMAVVVGVVLVGLGITAGIVADRYQKWDAGNMRQVFFEMFRGNADAKGPNIYIMGGASDASGFEDLVVQPLHREPVVGPFPNDISIERIPFLDRAGKDDSPFTRVFGDEIGIDEPYTYSVTSFLLSLTRFRGIASGDIHNDGRLDILLTSSKGLSLYANQGGTFIRQTIDSQVLSDFHVVDAAFVDFDSDGWQDIVFATYRKGNYAIYNRNGHFAADTLTRLPNHPGAILTGAMGFGDIDQDGDLDAVFGNYAMGSSGLMTENGKRNSLAAARDALVINEGGQFAIRHFSPVAGNTMSSLLSDINGDGWLDLISVNDFDPPDLFFFGDESGGFSVITREEGIIPHSGTTTMNVVTADINNDLVPEIFLAQISGRAGRTPLDLLKIEPAVCNELEGTQYHADCNRIMLVHADMMDARTRQNMDTCLNTDPEFKQDCVAVIIMLMAMKVERDEQLCDLFQDQWWEFQTACHDYFGDRIRMSQEESRLFVRQQGGGNVLLTRTQGGRFEDVSEAFGLEVGGWSWNARFADVDNDEWQDIYVVNGDYMSSTREPNFFYRNNGGTEFVDFTQEYGLGSFLATSAYTYIDMDNDGDLDIISVPEVGPIIAYQNNLQASNAVEIDLQDHSGNRSGIGSKITIYYGPQTSRHQMREIQMSGGFVSFDAPIAHFGLGQYASIDRIQVEWSTGERTLLEGPFSIGARYTITRHAEDVGIEGE